MNRYTSQIYTRYEDLDKNKIEKDIKLVKSDKYNYPKIHIAPRSGLLNDPNGLIYFEGKYHIFYQVCPNGPFHGMKSWNLVTTTDFINYQDHGIILTASEEFDNFGIFSGGATVIDGQLALLYTGNHRDAEENYNRKSYQVVAILDENYQVVEKRVIKEADFTIHTEHFRDPVALDAHTILIGAQDTNLNGQLALIKYSANNYQGKSRIEFIENNWDIQGFMYECPNLFELDNQMVTIFSPQGVESQDKFTFNNIHDVVYSTTEKFSLDQPKWNNPQVTQLDFGFDFYAPQVFKTDQRTLMIGWLGVPDTIYPGDEQNGWSQMLTIVRELKLVDNKLYQTPVIEYEQLASSPIQFNDEIELTNKAFRFNTKSNTDFSINIGNDQNWLTISREGNELCLDRSKMQYSVNEQYGTKRYVKIDKTEIKLDMILDMSAIEIFVNDGEYVLSSRFFIDELTLINTSGCFDNQISYLNSIKIKENNE